LFQSKDREERNAAMEMTTEEQVQLLMQGTEYGDDELKQAMTDELRQRLV
jgi:hypothetical protein